MKRQKYLDEIRCAIRENRYDEISRLPVTVLRVAEALRNLVRLDHCRGEFEFDPPALLAGGSDAS